MKTFFISSTFKDMQAERDILHERIFPRLRTTLKGFGEEIQEVDLRWGVDTVNMTEEESGHEVLKICIDAIDRCKPYIVVLLGERYGWIPGMKIVESARDTRIGDRYEPDMSITELEIQYGALLNESAFDQCVFCFRNPSLIDQLPESERPKYCAESDRHAMRLTALKNQIRRREGAVILEYCADWDENTKSLCGLESFESQLYQLLETMLCKDLNDQKVKSLQERQVEEVELIKQEYLSTYIRRYPEEFWICKHLSQFQWDVALSGNRKMDCLLVSGDAGSGKSALMAYMASSIPKCKDVTILCFASASGCRDVPSLKRYIAYRLETLLGEVHNEAPKSVDEHLRTLDKKAKGRGIVCFVDGLDQIYHGQSEPYIDLPALCPNLFWVFSALPDFPFSNAAADYTYEAVPVDQLYTVQRREMIVGTAGKRGKTLDNDLIQMITGAKGAGNPLFLSLVLQRFFMMNKAEFEAAEALAPGMDGLHRYMQQLMTQMPDLPDQMASYILDVTARLFDQDQFREVLMLIAVSHNGLTEKELEDILKLEGLQFSQIKFQQTVSYLYDAFNQRSNGKWTFHHRLFSEAVTGVMTPADHERIKDLLVRYSLESENFLQQEGFRYLLDRHHSSFAQALECSREWDTRDAVLELVGAAAEAREENRAFFAALARQYPSNGMAGFWLAFSDFLYGKEVEQMAVAIVRELLEAPLSNDKKWQLALRLAYYVEKPELLSLIERAEYHAATLPEPERTIANAYIQAELAQVQTSLYTPYTEICQSRKNALAFVDRAMVHLGQDGKWENYLSLLETLKLAGDNASSWQDPETDKLLLHSLELLEQIDWFATEQEDDYTYYKIRFLYQLSDLYCDRQHRDYDKAKKYGNQALELAEIAVSQRPTVRNLENRVHALKAYTRWMKDEYQHPYWQQAVECTRRIWASAKTDQYKRMLASNEAEYAITYLKAVIAGKAAYQLEQRTEIEEIFNHSCVLFEELSAAGYYQSQLAAYAAFLAEWAELCANAGYLCKSLAYGQRCIQQLEARRQDVLKKYAAITNPDANRFMHQQLDWVDGWMGRVKGTIASVYTAQLKSEEAERYAREGLELNLRNAKRRPIYYGNALSCALWVAQNCYYQRKDAEALSACDYTQQLLEAPEAERYNRSALKAELLYIRSRIALAQGALSEACEYLQECEAQNKQDMLKNKLLILKADCLQAQGDPASDEAWLTALQCWRKLLKADRNSFERNASFNTSQRGDNTTVNLYWRETRLFALSAYYMAYCYYHYVTNEQRLRQDYDDFERKLLYALTYLDKGYLKGKHPLDMQVEILNVTAPQDSAICSDFEHFIAALNAMTNWNKPYVEPAICQVILENIDRFPDAVPDREQYNTLNGIARILYDQLLADRREIEYTNGHCTLLQEVLPVQKPLPVFEIHFAFKGDKCTIWPQEYVEKSELRWYALMKLLLLMLRRDSILNHRNGTKLRSVYRVVSSEMGGRAEIEKADLSFLPNQELEALRLSCDMEHELRILRGNIYWYALKNVWIAELFRRTGNMHYLTGRIRQFAEFLTEPYEKLYQELDARGKKSMPQEILNAVMHLVRVLVEKGMAHSALPVIQWSESVPVLAGGLNAKTLYSVQADTDEGRVWLEDAKLRYCKKWMEQDEGSLRSIRHA